MIKAVTQPTDSLSNSSSEPTLLKWPYVIVIAAVHLVALTAPLYFSWQALGVAIFLHWLCGSIGICLGYHRLLTHRSFKVPKWLEYTVVTIGALALQGGPLFWVSKHRMHHAFTEDNQRDPYSAKRGFWWSRILWIVYSNDRTNSVKAQQQFAPKIAKDTYYCWLNKNFVLLQVALGLVLFAVGGWSYVVYGIFVRSVFLWHSTWLINSASHVRGYRTFETEDGSRNLWWAALLTYGEGWHNNHHAEPDIAPAGRQWWEIDPTWWVIFILESLGLARSVRRPAH